MNPNKSHFHEFQSSTEGIPNSVAIGFALICIVFVIYLIFRIRKSLRDEK